MPLIQKIRKLLRQEDGAIEMVYRFHNLCLVTGWSTMSTFDLDVTSSKGRSTLPILAEKSARPDLLEVKRPVYEFRRACAIPFDQDPVIRFSSDVLFGRSQHNYSDINKVEAAQIFSRAELSDALEAQCVDISMSSSSIRDQWNKSIADYLGKLNRQSLDFIFFIQSPLDSNFAQLQMLLIELSCGTRNLDRVHVVILCPGKLTNPPISILSNISIVNLGDVPAPIMLLQATEMFPSACCVLTRPGFFIRCINEMVCEISTFSMPTENSAVRLLRSQHDDGCVAAITIASHFRARKVLCSPFEEWNFDFFVEEVLRPQDPAEFTCEELIGRGHGYREFQRMQLHKSELS